MKKFIVSVISILMLAVLVTGCGAKQEKQEGHSLFVFCGAGMKEPFEEIAKEFKETTGYDVQVTYANAAQIQTQIKTAKEGDFFIAGSMEEVKPVEEFVDSSKELVKHIPVLAVDSKNSKQIQSIQDLTGNGVRLIVGDPEATPIGKIANKLLGDFKIKNKVQIVSNTATAPAMMTALEAGEADVAIVWKENVNEKKCSIVNTDEMNQYIKTIPAAALNTSKDKKVQEEFNQYLASDSVKKIWQKFGYELAA